MKMRFSLARPKSRRFGILGVKPRLAKVETKAPEARRRRLIVIKISSTNWRPRFERGRANENGKAIFHSLERVGPNLHVKSGVETE